MYYRRPSDGPGDYFFLKELFGSPSPEQKAEQQRKHEQFWNGVGSVIKATKKHWDEKGKAIDKAINGITAITTILTGTASDITKALYGQEKASKPVQVLKSTSPPSSTQKVTPTTAAPEVDHDIEENLDNDSDRDDDDDEDSEYYYYDEEHEESSADYEDS